MNEKTIQNLIIRWLDNSIEPAEEVQLYAWIKESDYNRRMFFQLYKSWNLSQAIHQNYEDEQAFTNLLTKITLQTKKKELRKPIKLYWLDIAVAICVAVIAVAVPIWQSSSEQDTILSFVEQTGTPQLHAKETQLIISADRTILIDKKESSVEYSDNEIKIDEQESTSKEDASPFNQLITPYGKKSTITFEDGTKVWANAGTRVVYPIEFGKNIREIYVDGEVYIEVVKNADRPFVVRTSDIDVTVLGTSFNINSYPTEKDASVVLVSGSVKLKTKQNTNLILKPNQRFVLEKETGLNSVQSVTANQYSLWTKGMLQFRNEKLEIILNKLQKYYGIEIEGDASTLNLKYSGKLDLENSFSTIMKHITHTLPITYKTIDGSENKYIIEMKK